MSNYFTTKQTQAIKTLLYNQDFDSENIQLLKCSFKKTDSSDMTLDEAQNIVAKMPLKNRLFVNDMLLGKVKPLIPERYFMEKKAERLSKSTGFSILMGAFLIGTVAFGIALVCIAFTGIWGFLCGLLALV